jgi:hypothetical protein
VYFVSLLALLAPLSAQAQLQPHRAEYVLRLGAAPEAARIGRAVQDLSQDCGGWHIARSVRADLMLTPALGLALASKLTGDESRRALHYETVQVQSGMENRFRGRVERQEGELRAEIATQDSAPRQLHLPPATLLPVAALQQLIERLRGGADSFRVLAFDAEIIQDAFLVEVTRRDPASLRLARPADGALNLPSGKWWAVNMAFTRGRQDEPPLFNVGAKVFDNGVLDRLTIETGLLSITGDLRALEMRSPPACSRS